ncbi:MAG TPA: chromate transporter [Erysipelotrichaceae bacterium]|nr:chromate transporter [Erysipelotrichaceae bacterium]
MKSNVLWKTFLKDAFICSLGAYGGPEAHYGVFIDQLVVKKQYLSEEEMVELIALTGILPGPSSTQTLVAIGYKVGGPLLAFLTLIVWALPVILVMTLLSFLWQFFNSVNLTTDIMRFISPMAVGFIALAAYRLGTKVITSSMTAILFLFGALTTYLIQSPWIYPTVLLFGGLVSVWLSKEKNLFYKISVKPPWVYLGWFAFFAMTSLIITFIAEVPLLAMFERFYRYGYLVIGGGQVVVPLMYGELVEINQLMTSQQFLTGFGLVQGLPGPMFSFSAYAGGIAASTYGPLIQVASALLSGVAIFLPGVLLIFFVYPIWEEVRRIQGIKVALKGITAVAAGLIGASAIILLQRNGVTLPNVSIVLLTTALLYSKKVPAPLIVVFMIALGLIL